jgi:hypothetical protein
VRAGLVASEAEAPRCSGSGVGVVVGVVVMDAGLSEADSSRGGAVAGLRRRLGLVRSPCLALSVDFHGVFAGPRLRSWCAAFLCEFVCRCSAASC